MILLSSLNHIATFYKLQGTFFNNNVYCFFFLRSVFDDILYVYVTFTRAMYTDYDARRRDRTKKGNG